MMMMMMMMMSGVLAQDNCYGTCTEGTVTGSSCPDCGTSPKWPSCKLFGSSGPTGECCYCGGDRTFQCRTCKQLGKNATDEDVGEEPVVATADEEEAPVEAMETKDESGGIAVSNTAAITFAAATAVVAAVGLN